MNETRFGAAVRAARTTAYWFAGTDDERMEAIVRSALRGYGVPESKPNPPDWRSGYGADMIAALL